jgi:hypothetical protein
VTKRPSWYKRPERRAYRGADNPNNPHPVKIPERPMKLVPVVRPFYKGRRSRRLRKNKWVPK